MNININDEFKIRIYELDSYTTIISRIASFLETIPEFILLVNEPEQFTDGMFIRIINLDDERKEEPAIINLRDVILYTIREFSDSIIAFITYFKSKKISMTKNILTYWMTKNSQFQTLAGLGISFTDIIQSANNELPDTCQLDNAIVMAIATNPEMYAKSFEQKVSYNKTINEHNIKQFAEFSRIKQDDIPATDFIKEKIEMEFELNINYSLLELFNKIITNSEVPFATINSYYKVMKNFSPHKSWIEAKYNQDVLYFKVCNKKNPNSTKESDYTTTYIFEKENKKYMSSKITLSASKTEDDVGNFKQRVAKCFDDQTIEFSNDKEISISGIFFLIQVPTNTYVLLDLIMNNNLFSHFMSVDEITKTTKRKKEETGLPWVYFYFKTFDTGLITASITSRLVENPTYFQNLFDNSSISQHFAMNDPYTRIRCTGKDIAKVHKFINFYLKLMTKYQDEENTIVEYYQRFIPDFNTQTYLYNTVDVKLDDMHKLQLKDLFVRNFTRHGCPRGFKILSIENDAEEIKNSLEDEEKNPQGKIIKFPRDIPVGGEVYESDGKNQFYWKSADPKYPYMGIKVNKTLSNSAKFPFIPCSFETSQLRKENFLHYYEGIKPEEKKFSTNIITTNKILNFGARGVLSSTIEHLFTILDKTGKYYRVGVDRTPSSFLSCILYFLNPAYNLGGSTVVNYRNMNAAQILSVMRYIRNELSKKSHISRQFTFNIPLDITKNMIENDKEYFDPKLFLHLCEFYFKKNIFVFNETGFVFPHFVNGYYTYKNDYDNIYIYEHYGSESDNAVYPQCELILQSHTDIKYKKFSIDVKYIFNNIIQSYKLNKKIEEINIQSLISFETLKSKIPNFDIISQHIDSSGKTRKLTCKYNNLFFNIFTSPLPPIDVAINIDNTEYQISEEDEKTIRELINVDFEISFQHETIEKQSHLTNFIKFKKYARYIVEYLFWVFSNYINIDNKKIDLDTVKNFANQHMIIIDNYEYKNIEKQFSMKSSVIKDERYIISSSEEMKKRLIYTLYLTSRQNPELLLNYYQNNYIVNYYMDITDFDENEYQILFQDKYTIEQYYNEQFQLYKLNSEILLFSNFPYFFRNKLIDNVIYLAQNIDSENRIFDLYETWRINKYNKGVYADISDNKIGYNLYEYKSSQDIKLLGEKNSENINVLKHNINDVEQFTVLLPL